MRANKCAGLCPLLDDRDSSVVQSGPFGNQILGVKALLQGIEDDCSETSSSNDSSNLEHGNLEEIAEDLKTDTVCLMKLGPLLTSPVFDAERGEPTLSTTTKDWAPHRVYCDKIENRFPGAEKSLVSRLGKANWERFLRCQESHQGQADHPLEDQEIAAGRAATFASSKFRDSALEPSLSNMSSYTETIMSYRGGDGRSIKVPPLSAEAKAGNFFNCIACGKSVRIMTNSAWKRHLYSDLCPWLCIDAACTLGDHLFRSRNNWISHLARDHGLEPRWEAFECPLCQTSTGNGKTAITKHLSNHLEEISLSALSSRIERESESENGSQGSANDAISNESQFGDLVSNDELNPMPPPLFTNPASSTSKALERNEEGGPAFNTSRGNQPGREDPVKETSKEKVSMPIKIMKCVCGIDDHKNRTPIYCETCSTWQHIACYYPNNLSPYGISFKHACNDCRTRSAEAVNVQKNKGNNKAPRYLHERLTVLP